MALLEFFRKKRRNPYPHDYPRDVSELPPWAQEFARERQKGLEKYTREELDEITRRSLEGHEEELRQAIADADAMRAQRRRERERG